MLKQLLMAALLALLMLRAGDSRAASSPVFVQALNAADMVHDFRRNRIYIASGNQVVCYSLATNQFLPAIPLDAGAQAKGIDISRDGNLLAVADQSFSSTQAWIYLIDLQTGVASKRAFSRKTYGDGGTWSVAFGADDNLLVATDYPGSGSVPLRRLTLSTGQWAKVGTVGMRTMLAASTDRQTIALAEANVSDGPWGVYDVPTGQLVERTGYTDGTSSFNFEIATDALGGTFAIPTGKGMYVYDAGYQKTWTIPALDNLHVPIGVAFHPVQPLLYYPIANTNQMHVFNTGTGKDVAWYDMGVTFKSVGSSAYGPGRTKLSADGSLLMMNSSGGIRYIRFYAPLTARTIVVSATTATSKSIVLPGSIGNHGTLVFRAWGQPKHGTLTISGSTATYKSEAGYKGTDSFGYMVRYGAAASAIGTVTVRVQ